MNKGRVNEAARRNEARRNEVRRNEVRMDRRKGGDRGDFRLPVLTALTVAVLLAFVQLKVERPMLLLERFLKGGGWLEILLVSFYGGLVAFHMQDPARVQRWRTRTWALFSAVFFSQLILGLFGFERFLMTGKLHLPVPMMILAGPIYRGHLSVMTILFLSTVVLSGPAWCSHICYFGALDSLASTAGSGKKAIPYKWALKSVVLVLVVLGAIALRMLKVPVSEATLIGGGFGIAGLGIILLVSRKAKTMVHCTAYCPIGTIVNLAGKVNPLRLEIDEVSCTGCMACTRHCRYDALNREHILARKPGVTCTLCGDCISSCHAGSLRYRLFDLSPTVSRNLYLGVTITLHAATLVLARI